MNRPPNDQQLWSWVDQDSPELSGFLAEHPEHRPRVDEIRLLIRSLASPPGTGAETAAPRIPRFTIVRVLGAGGMGIVYEAWQEDLQRRVALKVLRGGPALDERRLQLFEREAKALARVEHPDIARIYEAGRTEAGQPWLVMELAAGVPLSDYVRSSCRDRADRLALFARICDAVHHAHVQGVVHRDLKPGNVLVDPAGNPKVLDFGLARFTDAEATRATMDGTGLLGTLAYMSPEQACGKSVDARSDVYSLGVMLYEKLLTGALPHDIASPGDALRVLREEPPRRPSSLDPSLRGDLETITLAALEKEPRHRCQSAKALADDVRRQLAGAPILSRPQSLLRRTARAIGRHRLAVAALALLAAALGVAAWSESVRAFVRTNLSRRITGQDYAKASPFTAVRWRAAVPEVEVPDVTGGWHELLEIEGVRAGLLVEFCKQTGDVWWRKRFDEDLVEVLARVLGRAPGAAVRLKLRRSDPGAASAFEVAAAPMTEKNRRAVWDARGASPFTAVRWNGDVPEVLVDGSWGELLSAEGVPAGRLVELCKEVSRRHWKEVFEGTPVDALTNATGKTPDAKVRLELRDPEGGVRSTEAPLVLYTVRSGLRRGR